MVRRVTSNRRARAAASRPLPVVGTLPGHGVHVPDLGAVVEGEHVDTSDVQVSSGGVPQRDTGVTVNTEVHLVICQAEPLRPKVGDQVGEGLRATDAVAARTDLLAAEPDGEVRGEHLGGLVELAVPDPCPGLQSFKASTVGLIEVRHVRHLHTVRRQQSVGYYGHDSTWLSDPCGAEVYRRRSFAIDPPVMITVSMSEVDCTATDG